MQIYKINAHPIVHILIVVITFQYKT
jgi:hypothetical protein